eukprot:7205763-Prymnesium_polylepis.1
MARAMKRSINYSPAGARPRRPRRRSGRIPLLPSLRARGCSSQWRMAMTTRRCPSWRNPANVHTLLYAC